MSRPKRRIFYNIEHADSLWWSAKAGKWVKLPPTEETGNLSNVRHCYTMERAYRAVENLPAGSKIIRLKRDKYGWITREWIAL